MAFKAGDKFGEYEILDLLGTGGMAIVYKARDAKGQIVALKVLLEHMALNAEIVKRFEREAQIIEQLDHKNIVQIYGYGTVEDQPYLATEFMAGGSLDSYFKNPRKINLKQSLHIIKQVATALDYAHQQNIIHRDIKLENILTDGKGRYAVTDFGIARALDETRLTATGGVLGTPYYMSPEQAIGEALDWRTDLYSLGVMSYLLFTGRYPFTGPTPLEVITKRLQNQPPMPTDVNPKLPETIDPVIQKSLHFAPEGRYQSGKEMFGAMLNAIKQPQRTQVIVQPMADNVAGTRVLSAKEREKSGWNVAQEDPKRKKRPALAGFLVAAAAVLIIAGFLIGGGMFQQEASAENLPSEDADLLVAAALTGTAENFTETPTITPSMTRTEIPTWTPTATWTTTFTPQPTDTPDSPATATNRPIPDRDGVVEPNAGVWLRDAPHTGSFRIRLLEKDTELYLLGRTDNNDWYWAQTLDNERGWVASDYVMLYDPYLVLDVTWDEPPPQQQQIQAGSQSEEQIDSDGDGYWDQYDACPQEYSTVNYGCPEDDNEPALIDSDGDNVVDHLDECPFEYGEDIDGCPEEFEPEPQEDSDGDGIPDYDDECPDLWGEDNGCPENSTGGGEPDGDDIDGDGINDAVDECPRRPGPRANDGCPVNAAGS